MESTPHLKWRDEFERVKKFLSLGIDDTISIGVPFGHHPDVSVRTWRKVRPDEPYPLLFKEYETPKGR